MYDYWEHGRRITPQCKYSLKKLMNNPDLLEKEIDWVFYNLYGAFNKTDILEDIYRYYDLERMCDDQLLIMLGIETKFYKFGVELTEELLYQEFKTFQDIYDEIKKQLHKKYQEVQNEHKRNFKIKK